MSILELPDTRSPLAELLQGIRAAGAMPLEQATTMPPRAYCSDDLYQLEIERVFRPGWLYIGRANEIPNVGDYKTVDIIGEQLVMCRDKAGEVRVMSRVCLHRWMEVATGHGNVPAFQCPYHLWTFSLDGRLVGAPEMGGVAGFDKQACQLPQIRHEIWQGFVFVNLDGNARPLGEELAPLAAQLAALEEPCDATDHIIVNTWEWGEDLPGRVCPWDWKVLVENFMECYHHLGPHGKSLQPISPANRSWTDTSNHAYSYLHSVKTDEAIAENPDLKGAGNLLHIYPLMIWGIGPNGSSVHRIYPEGAGKCRVFTDMLVTPKQREREDWDEWLANRIERSIAINKEDFGACIGVQKAAAARNAQVGRLSLLEQPLWEFYQYLANALTA